MSPIVKHGYRRRQKIDPRDRTSNWPAVTGNTGLWGPALSVLDRWDPDWARSCQAMGVHPWRAGVLGEQFAELVGVALNAACTQLDGEATRRHIRAALALGATREQILFVIKCATVVSLHALSVAAPILTEEYGSAAPTTVQPIPTPSCDALKDAGRWNSAWDEFAGFDPAWTERFMTAGVGIYADGVFSPKEVELLSIALDASVTHLYAPGIRRHIRGALDAGASSAEIVAVLQLCVSQGVQACNLAIPILESELARNT